MKITLLSSRKVKGDPQMKRWPGSMIVSLMVCLGLLFVPLSASAELVKKVDNFIIFLDQSGSMVHHPYPPLGENKHDLALDAISRLDQIVPELGYTSTSAAFSPYKVLAEPAVYRNGALASAFASPKPLFNQFTTLGDGLNQLGPVISNLSGKTALIIFTDGNNNAGAYPVPVANNLYTTNAGDLCIHIVSLADTDHGEQVIKAIRNISDCSVAANIETLADDAALGQFARNVLYEDVAPAPAPKPAPVVVTPAPVVKPEPVIQKEVITFNLLFGFDKWHITDEMVPVLEQVKGILEENPDVTFTLAGHTDSIGTDVYNQGLSERRAGSVKAWLVDNGIDAHRLKTVGYGESRPKYDNSTSEGRALNRRVELISEPMEL